MHHPISKPLQTVPRCQLNTLNPLPPPDPVVVPLPPVLNPQARPDPPPALDILPMPRPIMHTIKGNSSSHWPSPSQGKRRRCHYWAPWAHKSSEEWTSPSSLSRTKASHIAPRPTWRPNTSSQRSLTTARKRSSKQSNHQRISEEGLGEVEIEAEGHLPTRR
jgi:hypothetical protein